MSSEDIVMHPSFEAQRAEQVTIVVRRVLHDVNNLLAVIQGAHHLLRSGQPHPSALDYIAEASEGSGEAIERLLLLLRPGSCERPCTDTTEALRAFAEPLCSLLPKGTQPVLEVDDGLPAVALSAADLETIVITLVNRACHAMTMGGELRISAVAASAARSADQPPPGFLPGLHLVVSDQGKSLEPDVAHQPSESAAGAERLPTVPPLDLVKRIVAAAGGSVSITGSPQAGTRVAVALPAATTEPPDAVNQAPTEHKKGN